MTRLSDFPDEIIRHILHFVSAEDNLRNFQLVSRRLHNIANEPLLWRTYCLQHFHFWDPDHELEKKLKARASSVGWKKIWLKRRRTNREVERLLDGIVKTTRGQVRSIATICEQGLDAKDYLLDQRFTDESDNYVLARRYWAQAALDSLHRGLAVDVWSKYQGRLDSRQGLDIALGAFDMFVLHDQTHDLDYIVQALDDYAAQYIREHPQSKGFNTRDKAINLVRWLRLKNYIGAEFPISDYRKLQHCLIGHALSESEHTSLPLIAGAIFVCVAQRLGINTACLNFPGHVYVSVEPPAGEDLDGELVWGRKRPTALHRMYLDPFSSDHEIPIDYLRAKLAEHGWPSNDGSASFHPSPVPIVVQRMAKNIKTSWAEVYSLPENDPKITSTGRLRSGVPLRNLNTARYAAMWAELITKDPSNLRWSDTMSNLLNECFQHWPEDLWIIERYLLPVYKRHESAVRNLNIVHRAGWQHVPDIIRMMNNLDSRGSTVCHRRYTEDIHRTVRYKIGQVFRHKRYGYVGVINGWRTRQMRLPEPHTVSFQDAQEEGGRLEMFEGRSGHRQADKIFYTCVRPSYSRLRIAQENVEIITDPSLIPDELFTAAGKYFKRFDRETCTFVSNIREYYPDD
ncbi:hypothetical protein QBC40DRAFT_289796 [Triangularia verruculosa]|uniref:F-box domain-containing protein n=1 Tax=Triangularia verruculosa TaxID=2587418 RepID=A0AAN7APV7_9PEZI|nr:hypothetical protein QBC40DRAFT_289796 [Triangularia verruculosa]